MSKLLSASLLLGGTLLCAQENLLDLDLEDLSQIQTNTATSTLIKTKKKYSPSTTTRITQRQIQESGARTLDELLEIYVPELTYMYKADGNQMGIEGIISDRNNKILMVVNGRIMNVQTRDGGAITERFFPLLGDIKEIQVLSGPGAVIYGPGAIAGVISITTFDAKSFDGLQSNAALGYREEFGYVDLKYATTLSNDIGIFIYAGIDNYEGVDKNRVKNRFAFSNPSKGITADKDFPDPTVHLNGHFEEETRKKIHIQLQKGGLKFWSRYSQNSLAVPSYQGFYLRKALPPRYRTGFESDQLCSVLSYKQNFSDLSILYTASYLRSELEKNLRFDDGDKDKKINEDNFNLKALLTYHHSDSATYAIGAEYTKYRFKHYKNSNIKNNNIPVFDPPKSWNTDLSSLYTEAQYNITNTLMTILDARVDKHSHIDAIYSGRVAAIFQANERNLLKLNFSHANRYSDEVDMYQRLNLGEEPDTESIERFEFIYTSTPRHWSNTLKLSYNIEDVVAYDLTQRLSRSIGRVQFYTIEGILSYHNASYTVSLSHLYTGLRDFSLSDEQIKVQNVSADAYGYGKHLANWNSNITKLRFDYNYDSKLKFISSLRVFWGLEGAKEMADYNKANYSENDKLPHGQYIRYKLPYYDTSTKAFGPSAYLNMSLRYRLNKQTTLYLHGYNLLGLIDEDLNKRNYFQTSSNYLIEEPALSVALNYKFF